MPPTDNLFKSTNHSDPLAHLAYTCVHQDIAFSNTSDNWLQAFEILDQECAGNAAALRSTLKERSSPIRQELERSCGPHPAGVCLVGENELKRVCTFILAAEAYEYLQPDRRRAVERGEDDEYLHPVNPDNPKGKARCVCFFIARAASTGEWWRYFKEDQVVGDGKAYFFVCVPEELRAFVSQVRSKRHEHPYLSLRVLGKPGYGPRGTEHANWADCVICLALTPLTHSLHIPSILDAEAYEFFLPNTGAFSQCGRTVYVPLNNPGAVREGIREWVHRQVTLAACCPELSVIGPVDYSGDPVCPSTALQTLLEARVGSPLAS